MTKHGCDRMDYDLDRSCAMHPNRVDCPDALVYYAPEQNRYGLIVHDGSEPYIEISYCPLPESG